MFTRRRALKLAVLLAAGLGLSAGLSDVRAADAPAKPAAASARKQPPYIVIKLDDFRPVNGKVHPLWKKVDDYLKPKNIKWSIGVICETLGDGSPEFVKWVQDHRDSGQVEFWFHGWDHGTWKEGETPHNEFVKRPLDEQRKRFDDSQKLAYEKLGFYFETFGPPGGMGKDGSFDAATIQVMADEPHMKAWLYPQPLDPKGEELAKGGKVTILDRVWKVNFEKAVGAPDFATFEDGYHKYPDRTYFVLQGHAMQWGTAGKFEEFTKIIDFLVEQKAVFVTPMELAAALKKEVK